MRLSDLDQDHIASLFWPKVEKGTGCWTWTAYRISTGYGQFKVRRGDEARGFMAHRVAVWLNTGQEVADDMTVDHLCRNKACVNPAHLEVVTMEENNRRNRSDSCKSCGGDNWRTRVTRTGQQRYCYDCASRRRREWRARRRAA